MKTALITGASSGLGLAMAEELGRRGWRVALLARRAELLEEHATRLRAAGVGVMAVPCDVGSQPDVLQAVRRVESEWGTIDLAIANAGVGIPSPAHPFPLPDSEAMMRTNFFGTMYLFAAVIPSMVSGKSGHFVGIASLAGLRGLPGSAVYSASKAAMQAFLEAVRVELRRNGVSVTTVNPGFIRTAMTEKNRFPMPFLMDVDRSARLIVDGLERKAAVIEFPFGTSLMMRVARVLPSRIYDRLMSRFAKRSIDHSKVRG